MRPHTPPTLARDMGALLDAVAAGAVPRDALPARARALAGPALDALPEKYGRALEGVLMRLESGAGFGEESCSFSVADLHAALRTWAAKAEAALSELPGP